VLVFLAAGTLAADVVTLNGGGKVQGNVVASGNSKTVAVLTSTGTLVVFDRDAVKTVKRVPVPAQKTASGKKNAAKPKLTAGEEAWMPKVRSLVGRLFGPDRDQSRRAASDLLKIDDENAIPALTRYLAANPNEESRQFYAKILRNIPGSKAVYCLVWQSLFDRSAIVRDTARKAIGSERGDLARPLFIQALRQGDRDLASLAAKGIAEIGDPNGDSVPYLIDAMVFQTVRVVATSPVVKVMDADVLADINLQNQLDAEARAAANAPPPIRVPRSEVRVGAEPIDRASSMGGSPLGFANITHPPTMGPIFPPMFGANNPQIKQPAITTSAPVTMRDILNTPVQYSTGLAREMNVNPAVHDTLMQITGQKLGPNIVPWRRWWANQQNNRALEKPKAADRPISQSPASH
jgi:hypothetical protein